jgi:PAS domain S-box-containing protein
MKSNTLFQAVARLSCYTLGLVTIVPLCGALFGNPTAGLLAVFPLFAAGVELVWANGQRGWRLAAYLACVVGMLGSGAYIVNESLGAHRDQAHVRAVSTRVRQMVESSPAAVLATDESGAINAANAPACLMTGYTREELIGTNIDRLFPVMHRDAVSRDDDADRLHGADSAGWFMRVHQGVVLQRKDGSRVPVTTYLFGIRYSDGRRVRGDIQFASFVAQEK